MRDDGRTALMHNKFWIFDSQSVWTRATNITHKGTQRNNNNVLLFESPALAASISVNLMNSRPGRGR
ncbi:MAG: hypothetical protein KDE58_43035 [Caldilineaceae bacterium]|nr:hypothetical protein [Caldilineaceae bacterium]